MIPSFDCLVVGAGFSGAVMARELAERTGSRVVVLEERDHIAGNCHTERDPATQVMIHRYGPHIFNTNREDVWKYVNRFGSFGPFVNRVKAITRKGVFSPADAHSCPGAIQGLEGADGWPSGGRRVHQTKACRFSAAR